MKQLVLGMVLSCATTWAFAQANNDPQPPVTLIADQMVLEADARLIASGNVEVLHGTTKLRANGITYDQTTDTLEIIGPITVIEGESIVILADSAELNADLRTGLLQGARIVFDQQLQVAANRIQRVNGRYTQMYKATASSCQVCGKNEVPLWTIRARRVVHDQEERQLYFDDATFRVLDVPVFYLPRLRLPDPTLERARGVLTPVVSSTSALGIGLKVPYFIPIGDHKDITLTPYLSEETRTLELRYRQAFRNGDIEINGAVTRDTIQNDMRGYVFADGSFALGLGYNLSFDIEATTDDAYLEQYDYSGKDRLDSAITVSRTRKDEHIHGSLTYYETLRDGEFNSTLPPLVGTFDYAKRFELANNSVVDLTGQLQSLYRNDTTDGQRGRDVTRASLGAHWHYAGTFGAGLVGRADAAVFGDVFSVAQDTAFEDTISRITPYVAAEMRWPLAMSTGAGVRHVIEPIAQLVWSQDSYDAAPNEDSTRVELDEGNLFALSRFDGQDARELGARATLGLSYTRYDPDGWSLGVTVGRSYRDQDLGQFHQSSGLAGVSSDWLAAVHLDLFDSLSLINRSVFDDDFEFERSETQLVYRSNKFDFASGYIWLNQDAAINRGTSISEWTADTAYRFNTHWTTTANWRYDPVINRTQRAGLGITYRNECVEMGVSASRRFTDSDSLEPETKFDFSVALKGFSTGGPAGGYAHTCK